jgi:FAD/FMN-containing dehydrogenase
MFRGAVLMTALLHLLASSAASDVSEALSERNTGTTHHAASMFFKCTSDQHVTVTSTEEISALIKAQSEKNSPVKIRATRPGWHSAAGFVCPGERGSTKLEHNASRITADSESTISITLLLHRMNRLINVNEELHQLTVEAGMTIGELLENAEAHGMSVIPGAVSIYANLTVGGIISASAHGSGSSLSSLVRSLKWVNGKGDVIVSGTDTEEGAALLGGIGLLGVITEITFQLEPSSLTVVEVREDLDDATMAAEVERIMKEETKYVSCYWRPDLGTYRLILYKAHSATAPPLDPNGQNVDIAGVSDDIAAAVDEFHAAWENDVTDDSDSADVLNAAACGAAEALSRAPVMRDGNGEPTKHITVPTNRAVVGAECAPRCYFDVHHIGVVIPADEFAIKFSRFQDWVNDARAIVKAELAEVAARLERRFGHGKRSCLPGLFMLRFGPGREGTLLSTNAGPDPVAYVQWLPANSARTPRKPGKHAPVYETLEQLTLCKYEARPAYGQNYERVFRHPRCHVRDHFPAENFERMLALQERHDPERLFEPKLFGHILSRSGPDFYDFCALEHWCFCEDDAHCPAQHACVASAVFPEYKICKVVVASAHDEL